MRGVQSLRTLITPNRAKELAYFSFKEKILGGKTFDNASNITFDCVSIVVEYLEKLQFLQFAVAFLSNASPCQNVSGRGYI